MTSIKPLPTPLVSNVLKLPDTAVAAEPGCSVQACKGLSTVPTQVALKKGIEPSAAVYVGPVTL